jgi:WD40 repeat protein/serine/threonine protein kinase
MTGKALVDELVSRWEELRARGEDTSAEELCRDHPELTATVESAIARLRFRAASLEVTSEWLTESKLGPSDAVPAGTTGAVSVGGDETEAQVSGLGPPQGPDEIGRLGTFRVIRLLGSGGMGSVYEAIDSQLARSVALKVLRPRLAGSDVARQRFLREARAAAKLEHDNVVAIYQVGEDNGVPYLAMPLLRGQSLHNLLQGGARHSIAEVLRIGREIAEGLAAAHAQRLIHRDIKPANIWIEEGTGRVKILDFGLARSATEAARLTQEGMILGTPAFMAPEQATGGRELDDRSDLFSLGCILYRMATGRLPFVASSNAVMLLAVAKNDPRPPRELNPDIPAGLDNLIQRLLAKDPAERPQSARAVVNAIRGLEQMRASAAAARRSAIPTLSIDTGDESSDSLVLRPASRARGQARSSGRWRTAAVVTSLILIGGLLAGINGLPRLRGVLYNQGTLVLQSPSATVAVAVMRDGHVVGLLDLTQGPVLHVEVGTYKLVLSDTDAPLKLASDQITVGPAERKVVRVLRAPTAAAAATWPPPPTSIEPWPSAPDDDDHLPGLIPHPAARAGAEHWQIETRRPRKSIVSITWSPDRRLIACASMERLVRIYETMRLDLVRVLVGGKMPVSTVAWSPDGKQLATGSEDGTVQLWAADGTPGPLLRAHSARITGLAWSPDGKELASASLDTSVRLWDRDGKPGLVLLHPDRVRALCWSPDGTRLVTGSDDSNVRLWSTDGTPGRVLKGHTQTVNAVAWSPNGTRIASAGAAANDTSSDTSVRLWNADGTAGPVLKGHVANVTSLAWSPDGKRLASAGEDKSVRLWGADGTPGKVIWGFAPVFCMVSSPDGNHLATAGGTRHLRIWNLDGEPGVTFVGYPEIEAVAVRPDGQRIASARRNSADVLLWGPDGTADTVLRGHTKEIAALAWSPDGQRIATGSDDTSVRLWEADGTPGPVLHGHLGDVLAVAWSPDGQRFATASRDMTARIWNADGTSGPVLIGNTGEIYAVAWCRDGKQIATAGFDGTVRVWDADGRPSPLLGRFPVAASSVAWSPDGTRIAAGNRRGDLQMWGAGGAPGPTLRGNAGHVTSIAWHPDSARLAVGGTEPAVRLWDINGVRGPVLSFDPESDASFVAWATSGEKLVAAGHVGSVRAWNGRTLEPEWIAFQTSLLDVTAFSASGRPLRSTAAALREFVYLLQRPGHGTAALTRDEFEKAARQPTPEQK